MVKGIIVLDVPEECRKCPFQEVSEENHMWCLVSYLDDCSRVSKMILDEYSKPDWCPIIPVPEKANHKDYCDNGRYDKGCNDCLNKIFWGGEQEILHGNASVIVEILKLSGNHN